MTDPGTPLCTWEQFTRGAFADLARGYTDVNAQNDVVLEGSRMCETACDRRFIPFTGLVETQRAMALDVEDALDSYMPLDPTSQLGMSRAMSLGSTTLVRHFWVREAPPRYPEMWTGAIASINLLRSFSGTQTVQISQIQYETDTGHVRFALGTFVPPGTTIVVNYSGQYATVPADLARAAKLMTASLILTELEPAQRTRDPALLVASAEKILANYMRGGPRGDK